MRDATARLLAPGGVLVPCGARVYVMAIELCPPEGEFDFGCLEQLRRGVYYTAARLHTLGHTKLTAPAEVLHFDFYSPSPLGDDGKPRARDVRLQLPVLRRGRCNAIVWWFDLQLDERTSVSAGPGTNLRTWKQNFSLHAPVHFMPGDTIEVLVNLANDDQINVFGGKPGTVRKPDAYVGDTRLEPTFT